MKQGGAAPTLEEIFLKYRDMVYRTCYRYVRDPSEAEDLSQEVFMKVHARLPGFRGDSMLTTWIYRIAVNRCIDHLRERRPMVEYAEKEIDPLVAGHLSAPDAALARIDLERLLAQTDSRTREILFLSLAEGCNHQEVGEVVGMSRWAVSKIVTRFQARARAGKKAWYRELFHKEPR